MRTFLQTMFLIVLTINGLIFSQEDRKSVCQQIKRALDAKNSGACANLITPENRNDYVTQSYRILEYAVLKGATQIVTQLVNEGVSIEGNRSRGHTPLFIVAETDDVQMCELLIRLGASVSTTNNKGNTPLHKACQKNSPNVAVSLAYAGIKVSAKNKMGWTPLHCAAHAGATATALQLRNFGLRLSEKDNRGRTALDLARAAKNEDFVRCYLSLATTRRSHVGHGKTGKSRTKLKSPAMHKTYYVNEINQYINESDALSLEKILSDLTKEQKISLKETFVGLVQRLITRNRMTCATLFFEKECVDKMRLEKSCPLHIAAKNGYTQMCQLLIEQGFSGLLKDSNGSLPLHYALQNSRAEIVRLLLDHDRTALTVKDAQGFSAWYYAVRKMCPAVIEACLEQGANPNTLFCLSDSTPLMIAVDSGNFEVCELLLRFHADPAKMNRECETALERALISRKRNEKIITLLKQANGT